VAKVAFRTINADTQLYRLLYDYMTILHVVPSHGFLQLKKSPPTCSQDNHGFHQLQRLVDLSVLVRHRCQVSNLRDIVFRAAEIVF
jgi:hypothetical protein